MSYTPQKPQHDYGLPAGVANTLHMDNNEKILIGLAGLGGLLYLLSKSNSPPTSGLGNGGCGGCGKK